MAEMGQSLSMSVYLEDNISEERKENIEAILTGLPGAEITGFISQEKAMKDLMEALGDQSGLLDGVTENPLPASFEIVFRNVTDNKTGLEKTKKSLEKMAGVEEVQYSEQWLKRLEGLMHILRLSGFSIGGLLCLGVLFIITNTIKLTIYSRREEIEIFKLVGATDWFVKIPFLIEGALQGLISGFLALSILFSVYSIFSLKHLRILDLPLLKVVFLPTEYAIITLSASFLLGLLGSLIAIGRFFKL
jgi:cell division transport system permease protein